MHRNGDCHDMSNSSLVITLKVSCSNTVLQSIFMNFEEVLFGSCHLDSSREEQVLCKLKCVVIVCVCVRDFINI